MTETFVEYLTWNAYSGWDFFPVQTPLRIFVKKQEQFHFLGLGFFSSS